MTKDILALTVWGEDKDRGISIDIGGDDHLYLECSEYYEHDSTASVTAKELYNYLHGKEKQCELKTLRAQKKQLKSDISTLTAEKRKLTQDVKNLAGAKELLTE